MTDRLVLLSAPPSRAPEPHHHDPEHDPECRRALRWELERDLTAVHHAIALLELSDDLLAAELAVATRLAANLCARLLVLDALDAEARRAA